MDYTKYNNQTKTNLKNIEQFLINKYGKFQPEWNTILQLLGDNLELYTKCKESIKVNGIYNPENGRKNPLLSTCKDLQATILKQIQHLGISPYAASKIKLGEEDDTEDFIDSLTD